MKKNLRKCGLSAVLAAAALFAVSVPQQVKAEGLLICPRPDSTAQGFAGGSGTEADPYQISNSEELKYLKTVLENAKEQWGHTEDAEGNIVWQAGKVDEAFEAYRDAYYVLTADVYLNDIEAFDTWTEAAPENSWDACVLDRSMNFTLDGAGYTIYGLYADNSFFENVGSCTIKNLNFAKYYVNGLAVLGDYIDGTTIENCTLTDGTLYCSGHACGGFVYSAKNASFTDCVNQGTVKNSLEASGSNAAGIAVFAEGSTFHGCENTGAITYEGIGYCNVAGVVVSANDCEFTECSNTALVMTPQGSASGVVAHLEPGKMTACSNTGKVTCKQGNAAGIISYPVGVVLADCRNEGKVTATLGYAGGIAACAQAAELNRCTNTALITNKTRMTEETAYEISRVATAGIVAYGKSLSEEQTMLVNACVNTGRIIGADTKAAGIAGTLVLGGEVYNCQNHGPIRSSVLAAGVLAYAVSDVYDDYQGEWKVGNCSNTAPIYGTYAGGVLGCSEASVHNCFNKGKVVAEEDDMAGAIAWVSTKKLTRCYFQRGSAGYGVAPGMQPTEATGTAIRHSIAYMKSAEFVEKLNQTAAKYENYEAWTSTEGKLNTYPYLENSSLVPDSTK